MLSKYIFLIKCKAITVLSFVQHVCEKMNINVFYKLMLTSIFLILIFSVLKSFFFFASSNHKLEKSLTDQVIISINHFEIKKYYNKELGSLTDLSSEIRS